MKVPYEGAIDCDLHAAVPSTKALVPYLDDYWRDQIVNRYIDRTSFVTTAYPPGSPLSARDDRRPQSGPAGSDFEMLKTQALDAFGVRYAICNVLHGATGLFNEDMAAALCAAVNRWVAEELLPRDDRLRASVLVTMQNPRHAVAEIEKHADDKRFVSVLLPMMGDMLLGRRILWPIYEAAEKYGLTLNIHAGSTYRYATTASGFPSYMVEDYVANGAAFENQVVALLAEGVFQRFPDLNIVMCESGVTSIPTLLWRTSKVWRGVRTEIPWVDRVPGEILRERLRVTLTPFDAPRDAETVQSVMRHIGSDDMILFSTDYPHWQYDGEDVLPEGLSEQQIRKILIDNPLATYPRLTDAAEGRRTKVEETVR